MTSWMCCRLPSTQSPSSPRQCPWERFVALLSHAPRRRHQPATFLPPLRAFPHSARHNAAQDGNPLPSDRDSELKELKKSLKDTQPIGPLAGCTRTTDQVGSVTCSASSTVPLCLPLKIALHCEKQARALMTFVDSIMEKTLRRTVVLTASRGRGNGCAEMQQAVVRFV